MQLFISGSIYRISMYIALIVNLNRKLESEFVMYTVND